MLNILKITRHISINKQNLSSLISRNIKPGITDINTKFNCCSIGIVDSPYKHKLGTPKQATISREQGGKQIGTIRLFPAYKDCILGLDGFDYIWVISWMHYNKGFKTIIKPKPRHSTKKQPPKLVGLFSSRSPHRPNPIALSALKIISVDIENGLITVQGLDLLHDTPILDIKPYLKAFDSFPDSRSGWMDDISKDSDDARINGYQSIVSKRGARANRARLRFETIELDRELERNIR